MAQIGLLAIMIELRITAFRVPVVWSHNSCFIFLKIMTRQSMQSFAASLKFFAVQNDSDRGLKRLSAHGIAAAAAGDDN